MFNFFDEFFKSDLAKNNILLIIALIAIFIIFGGLLVWLYHRFFKNKSVHDEKNELKKQLEEEQQRSKILEEKVNQLKEDLKKYTILEAIRTPIDENTIDPAIIPFIEEGEDQKKYKEQKKGKKQK